MLTLELSTWQPQPQCAYPPPRCTCAPGAPCAGDADLQHWSRRPLRPHRGRPRVPLAQQRAQLLTLVTDWLQRHGRLPRSTALRPAPVPGLSYTAVVMLYGSIEGLYAVCVAEGLCTPAQVRAAREARRRGRTQGRRRA